MFERRLSALRQLTWLLPPSDTAALADLVSPGLPLQVASMVARRRNSKVDMVARCRHSKVDTVACRRNSKVDTVVLLPGAWAA